MEPTAESKQFMSKLTEQAAPKWLSLSELETYLTTSDMLWCVVHNNNRVMPIDVRIIGVKEIIKHAQVIDLDLTCKAIIQAGVEGDEFNMRANMFIPKTKKSADVKRINYMSFDSFSRAFACVQDRDEYIDEIGWLSELLSESTRYMHDMQINNFFKFFGKLDE
jgi:hypothetical protein